MNERMYLTPVLTGTGYEVLLALPVFFMAVYYGAEYCEQYQDLAGMYSTCFEYFGLMAGVAGMILANIEMLALHFNPKTHVHAFKNMLLYKAVHDGLLTIFVRQILKWAGISEGVAEVMLVNILGAFTTYELFWSIYLGTGVADEYAKQTMNIINYIE